MRVERELEISEWLKTAETELEIKPSQYFALVKLLEDFHNDQLHKEQKAETSTEPESYTVRVICWDGVEYTREATKDEIDTQRKNGYVKEDGYSGITFDFRVSHGV